MKSFQTKASERTTTPTERKASALVVLITSEASNLASASLELKTSSKSSLEEKTHLLSSLETPKMTLDLDRSADLEEEERIGLILDLEALADLEDSTICSADLETLVKWVAWDKAPRSQLPLMLMLMEGR